jgi:hypothetical protein
MRQGAEDIPKGIDLIQVRNVADALRQILPPEK